MTHTREIAVIVGATFRPLLSGVPRRQLETASTTNEFRDALFVGSTCGPTGVSVAIRFGFDDDRSLGKGETGALDPLAPLLQPPPLALRAELPLPAAMLVPAPQIRRATLASSIPAAER